jgi:sec-independent protein translocase protein TatB
MFGTLGGPELFLIMVVALIVFGPKKLPEIGKSLGRMMNEFKKASSEFRQTLEDEVEADKRREMARIEAPVGASATVIEPATAHVAAPEPIPVAAPEPIPVAAHEPSPIAVHEAIPVAQDDAVPTPAAAPTHAGPTVSREPETSPFEPK